MGQTQLIEESVTDKLVWDMKDSSPTSKLATIGKLKLPTSKLTRSNLELLDLSQRDELVARATSLGIDLLALLDRARDGKLTRDDLRESGLFQSLEKKGNYNPISSEEKVELDSLLSILASPKLVDKPIEIPGVKFHLFQKGDGGFYSEKIKLASGEVITEGIQFNYSGKVVAVTGGEIQDFQGTISHPEKIRFRKDNRLYQIVRRERNLFAVEIQENSNAKVKISLTKKIQVSNTDLDNRTVTRVEREVSGSNENDKALHLTIQKEVREAVPEKESLISSRKTVIQEIGRYHSGLTNSIFGFNSVKEDIERNYVDGMRLLDRATGGRAMEILTNDNAVSLLVSENQSRNQELEKLLRNVGVATRKAVNKKIKPAQAYHEFELHIDPFLATGPHEAAEKTPFKLPKGVGVLTHLEYAPSPNSGKLKSVRFIAHNDLNFNVQNLRLEYERIFGPGIGVTLNKTRDGFAEILIAWPESFLRFGKRIKGNLISGEISNFLPNEITANIGVVWGDRFQRNFESRSKELGFTPLAENILTIQRLAPDSLHGYLFTGVVPSSQIGENLKPLPGLSPVLGENIRSVIAQETKNIIRSMTSESANPKAETALYLSLLKEHLTVAFKQLALQSKHRRGAIVGVQGGLTWHGPGWIVEPILTVKDQVGEQLEVRRKKVGSPTSKLQEANLISSDGRLILDLSPNESSVITIHTGKEIGLRQVSRHELEVVGSVVKVRESIEVLPSGRKQLSLSLIGAEEETEIAYRRVSRENLPDIESLTRRELSIKQDGSQTLSPAIESEIFVNAPTQVRYFRRHLYATPLQWVIGKLTGRKPHSHFISNESSFYD